MNTEQNEEPEAAGAGRLALGTALSRGLALRCPICGGGRLFRRFLSMHPRCSECSFKFERAPGYFLGSTYINYGVTALLTTVSYVVLHFGFRWGNEILLPALAVFCLVFPLVFFRFARSLWLSVDCCLDRVRDDESVAGASENPRESEVSNNDD